MSWDWISDRQIPYGAISSVILIVTVLVVKKLLLRAVLRLDSQQPEVRRRWVVNIRNAALVALMIGLIMIWATPLRTLAVSFIALAVAVVIATKELILCVSGSVVRATSKSYAVGDRIEIATKRGDVVDQNLFTTTLLEIGPGQSSHQYTGRAIVIPNSLLLNTPLINETFTHDYVLHVFCIPLTAGDDWQTAEQILLEAAQIECGPFLEQARMYMKNIESQHGLDSPTVAPRVTLQIPNPGKSISCCAFLTVTAQGKAGAGHPPKVPVRDVQGHRERVRHAFSVNSHKLDNGTSLLSAWPSKSHEHLAVIPAKAGIQFSFGFSDD